MEKAEEEERAEGEEGEENGEELVREAVNETQISTYTSRGVFATVEEDDIFGH
jgi:hypothetical protein